MKKLTVEKKNYIAGFLDGDGSIFAQIITDKNSKYGFKIRVSIGFYQQKEKHWFMVKLKKLFKYGSLRIRKDNVSEYVITSTDGVKNVLLELKDSLELKKKQANLVLKIIEKKQKVSSAGEFIELCKLVDQVAVLNYSKNRKITSEVVIQNLQE